MANHSPVEIDPKELARAEGMWGSFTKLIKWSIIASVAVLVLLAWLFV
ncbi:MAG: aa3-type cytochrome c oxidase subunit IV [Alphaproteobacteria bacterium]|nr:aa3-type cytochrome c oxidase subunit IV [Alphaproteobacteria bacterium]